MKKMLILIAVLFFVPAFLALAAVKAYEKNDGHVLTSLWKDYDSARKNDRPQKSAEILERIKKEASEKRLPWDYYDACREYVIVKSERNWKLRKELKAGLEEEIREYNDPLLSFLYSVDEMDTPSDMLLQRAEADAAILKKNVSRAIYKARPPFYESLRPFSNILVPTLKNDYEYVLWTLLGRGDISEEALSEVHSLLGGSLGGRYPEFAFAEYARCLQIEKKDDRDASLKDLYGKYEGKAFALVPMQDLMKSKFHSMEGRASSADYVKFRSLLESYEKERRMFRSGTEGAVARKCGAFAELIDDMEKEAAVLSVKDGKAALSLRNIDALDINVYRSKSPEILFSMHAVNPVKSFYVYDTVTVDLPPLEDGEYRMECERNGKTMCGSVNYDKYTISLAVRKDDRGIRLYAADSRTGRPLDKIDICLYKRDRVVAEASDVAIDGYTPFPENIAAAVSEGKSSYQLMCSCLDGETGMLRKSGMLYLYSYGDEAGYVAEDNVMSAVVFKDRSAFNPGDTVMFKSIVYRYSGMKRSVVPEGTAVVACLCDPSDKVLEEKVLETNEFGSVAGSFELSGTERRGLCSIRIWSADKGRLLETSYLRVDDFVLPSFDVSFDSPDALYCPGDTVTVSGRVIDFSGHGMAGAHVGVTAKVNDKLILDSPLDIGPDGTFSVSYVCGEPGESYCRSEVAVKVTDASGETLEFYHHDFLDVSPWLTVHLKNAAKGSFETRKGAAGYRDGAILAEDIALLECGVIKRGRDIKSYPLEYRLLRDGKEICGGRVMSGDVAELDFSDLAQGVYEFELAMPEGWRNVAEKKHSVSYDILKVNNGNVALDACVESYFRVLGDDGHISLEFGCGDGPVWAVVELFGANAQLLDSRLVSICGSDGCVGTVSYDYKAEYPDGVSMNVLYFRNGKVYDYTHVWTRKADTTDIPLEFVRFTDKALPGAECIVKVRTSADAEILAAVHDYSSEKIMPNVWGKIYRRNVAVKTVRVSSKAGRDGGARGRFGIDNGSALRVRGTKKLHDDYVCEEEAIPFQLSTNASYDSSYPMASKATGNAGSMPMEDVTVRENFSSTLAFEPFLRPSDDGVADFRFIAGDRISTYVVSVFAHDKDMNNAVVRRNMLVSMPVKVAVAEPQFLYEGDRYVLRASVSNSSGADVTGDAYVHLYYGDRHEGTEPVAVRSEHVTVPAHGTAEISFAVDVPQVSMLGFKVVFAGQAPAECLGEECGAAAVSDGLFVTVPVYAPEQTLTEAHSGLLLPGMSAQELENKLRGQFVNVTDIGAEYSEIALMSLLDGVFQEMSEPSGKDVISYTESLYSNMLAYGMRKNDVLGNIWPERVEKILACANADGGFGWFEGMASSPAVTAVVLERYAAMRDRGLLSCVSEELGEDAADNLDEAVVNAVKYLDSEFFSGTERPLWSGAVSLEQYLYIRSFYSGVPFGLPSGNDSAENEFRQFRKNVKEWLGFSRETGVNGNVLGKVRRIRTLMNLSGSEQGGLLAQAWGVSSRSLKRSGRTVNKDVVSLAEYAVKHPSGGYYYPNAVMPWRGLLESEAYAHSAICDLLRDLAASGKDDSGQLSEIADGIRLWIMIQKESQHWNGDPGFVEAAASVYDGTDEVKGARIMVLKKRYRKPFADIAAFGNGFRISAEYYRIGGADGNEQVRLNDGDSVHAGEKIVAKYSFWNEENRSFVLVSVPRPACLRPQRQLSGWTGGWVRPLAAGRLQLSPSAYREVKKDRTLFWFDMFPEENSEIEETFFVVQEGVFQSAVPEIESIYVPHYRANGVFRTFSSSFSD